MFNGGSKVVGQRVNRREDRRKTNLEGQKMSRQQGPRQRIHPTKDLHLPPSTSRCSGRFQFSNGGSLTLKTRSFHSTALQSPLYRRLFILCSLGKENLLQSRLLKHESHVLGMKTIAPQRSSVSGSWLFAYPEKFSLHPCPSGSPVFLFLPLVNSHSFFKSVPVQEIPGKILLKVLPQQPV